MSDRLHQSRGRLRRPYRPCYRTYGPHVVHGGVVSPRMGDRRLLRRLDPPDTGGQCGRCRTCSGRVHSCGWPSRSRGSSSARTPLRICYGPAVERAGLIAAGTVALATLVLWRAAPGDPERGRLRFWLAVAGAAACGGSCSLHRAAAECLLLAAQARHRRPRKHGRRAAARAGGLERCVAARRALPAGDGSPRGAATRNPPHRRRRSARQGIHRTGPRTGRDRAAADSPARRRRRANSDASRRGHDAIRLRAAGPGRAADPRFSEVWYVNSAVRMTRGDRTLRAYPVYTGGAALRARGRRHPAPGARGRPPGRRRHGARGMCPTSGPTRRGIRADRADRRPHEGLGALLDAAACRRLARPARPGPLAERNRPASLRA